MIGGAASCERGRTASSAAAFMEQTERIRQLIDTTGLLLVSSQPHTLQHPTTMFANAARQLARREAVSSLSRNVAIRTFASVEEEFYSYGRHVFTGKVADEYLQRHGASGDVLKDPNWVKDHNDTVAAAVFDW